MSPAYHTDDGPTSRTPARPIVDQYEEILLSAMLMFGYAQKGVSFLKQRWRREAFSAFERYYQSVAPGMQINQQDK
jgi:hypothetical protein